MALFTDHLPGVAPLRRTLFESAPDRPGIASVVLKSRPAPSRRLPQTTMPYRVCLRLAGAWLAALAVLLALVLALRWYA
jgi:hypothetical protein